MGKVKDFIMKHKKISVISMSMVMCFMMCSFCFAAEAGSSVPDLTPITTALTNAISVSDLVAIIANLIGYSMPFVLMWFAYRFLKRAFVKAVMAGRL